MDAFRGHNLAVTLREHGFRVNVTLMFEPYQTRLALQARPAYVNSFVRHHAFQSRRMAQLLDEHSSTRDEAPLIALRAYLVENDYLSSADADADLAECRRIADRVVVTAEPAYLARFTSTNQVVSYQRRFLRAAAKTRAARAGMATRE